MARRGTEVCLVATMMVLAALWGEATAQSSDCTNTLISLSPCLDYISGNSSKPSSGCCSKLGSVVKSQPECLCQVLNGGGSSMGINVNQTQALALPGACDVKTPSISSCNGASPSGSSGGTTTTESPKTKPSGTGSKNAPSTDASSSSTSTAAIPMLLVVLMFTASYGSTH